MDRYNDRYDDRYPAQPRPTRGQRDTDWADDLATRNDGRYPAQRTGGTGKRPTQQGRHDSYNDNTLMTTPRQNFRKRHPVLMNVIYILLTAMLLMWMLMWFLDFWTFHGEERVVPDVKGQSYATAVENASHSGMRAEITDSVFDSHSLPGTVVDQTPVAGARIKRGGTVYLTVVAFSPKLVTVPDFYNASARQSRSMFEGLGIKDIREVQVVSEYAGLVLGAKFNGVSLQPGTRIPVSAVVTLEVGSGMGDPDDYEEEGADIDSEAIDEMIEELDID